MAHHNTIGVHQEFFFYYGSHYQAIIKNIFFQMDNKVPTDLGKNQVETHGCTNLDFTTLGH
jgi:hypothetical protein